MLNKSKINHLLYYSLALVSVISLINIWAISNHLYFAYWWLDMLEHFLGGLWVGITFLWAYLMYMVSGQYKLSRKKVFWSMFWAFLVVAISWEIFELFVQGTAGEANFVSDTSTDLIIGWFGFVVAYRYFVFKFLKREYAE
jgi:hypothetical protein